MSALSGRVLVVEDIWLVAMDLQGQLEDLGANEVVCAHTLQDGLALLSKHETFQLALLDINIGSQLVFPLADQLRDANIPIIFVTAQQRTEFPPGWRDQATLVRKPISSIQLSRVIEQVLHEDQTSMHGDN